MERKSIRDVSMEMPDDIQEHHRKQELIGDGERVYAQIANPIGDADVYTLDPGDVEPHFVPNDDARLALVAYVESLRVRSSLSADDEARLRREIELKNEEVEELKHKIEDLTEDFEMEKLDIEVALKRVEEEKGKARALIAEVGNKSIDIGMLKGEIEVLKSALRFYLDR